MNINKAGSNVASVNQLVFYVMYKTCKILRAVTNDCFINIFSAAVGGAAELYLNDHTVESKPFATVSTKAEHYDLKVMKVRLNAGLLY